MTQQWQRLLRRKYSLLAPYLCPIHNRFIFVATYCTRGGSFVIWFWQVFSDESYSLHIFQVVWRIDCRNIALVVWIRLVFPMRMEPFYRTIDIIRNNYKTILEIFRVMEIAYKHHYAREPLILHIAYFWKTFQPSYFFVVVSLIVKTSSLYAVIRNGISSKKVGAFVMTRSYSIFVIEVLSQFFRQFIIQYALSSGLGVIFAMTTWNENEQSN